MTEIPAITEDHIHVLLDTINALRTQIEAGTAEPWSDYEGSDLDPKRSETAYLRLLTETRQACEDLLSTSVGVLHVGPAKDDVPDPDPQVTKRLEYLRGEIRAERISMGDLIELQNLTGYITADDIELAEWAGITEEEFNARRG